MFPNNYIISINVSRCFQVVTLATYLFFVFTVIGRQKINGTGLSAGDSTERMPSNRMPIDLDIYLPVYTILQFFFYMGLLKVSLYYYTVMKKY